ncbi:MAG: AI-2E family transporter [Thermomicrobiales bacterium]
MTPPDSGRMPRFAPAQVTPSTVLTVLTTALVVLGLLWVLWQLRVIVRWTVIALFLAVAMNPAVNRLQRLRIPRALAIFIVYLAVLLFFVGVGALVVPPLVEQGHALTDYVINLYNQRDGLIVQVRDLAAQYGMSDYLTSLQSQLSALPARLSAAAVPLLSMASGVIGSIYASITILLLSFFLLLDGERFVNAGLGFFPARERPRLRHLLDQAAGAVSGYITGNLLISLIAGAATFAFLSIPYIGMPYAIVLALIVAIFDLVPLVGATIGAIIVSVVGLFYDPRTGIILIIFFLVYQQIENNVLQPLVYGRSVKLHPLVVFLAVLAGGELLGILGALLAIPVAEILRIFLMDWLERRAPAVERALDN